MRSLSYFCKLLNNTMAPYKKVQKTNLFSAKSLSKTAFTFSKSSEHPPVSATITKPKMALESTRDSTVVAFKSQSEVTLLPPTDYEGRRNKLFSRPPPPPPITCGKDTPRPGSTASVSRGHLLTLPRKTKLDDLKDRIPIPEAGVPPTALHSWFDRDPNQKVPLLPSPGGNYIYFSRGRLGTSLIRCHPFFSSRDQMNVERVPSREYNALHDPHAKNYFQPKSVRSVLFRQGLINERDEVVCSFKDFNRFRKYLGTIYNDQVGEALGSKETAWADKREQDQRIRSYLRERDGMGFFLKGRRAKAVAALKENRIGRVYKYRPKEARVQAQLDRFKEERRRAIQARIQRRWEKEQVIAQRVMKLRFEEAVLQRELLKESTAKEVQAAERHMVNTVMLKKAAEEYKMEWIDNKFEYSKQAAIENRQIKKAMDAEQEKGSRKRQWRMEQIRKQLPARIAKKKAAEQRLMENVRKFAMRWLEKVRRRLHAPKDLQHESVWIGKSKGVLDDTLKYLKELSGYEKMDDFVLNIIKLKKQIQHQIELEEAEEAAAMAKIGAPPPMNSTVMSVDEMASRMSKLSMSSKRGTISEEEEEDD